MNFAVVVEPSKGSPYLAGPFKTTDEALEWIEKSFGNRNSGHPGIKGFSIVRISPVSRASWEWKDVESNPVV